MAKQSRSYDQPTIKKLFALSGNRCAFPDCPNPVIQPGKEGADAIVLGAISHISAASDRGPRANSKLTVKQRNSVENLIILCPTHHAIVDGQHEAYPESVLRQWKYTRENGPQTNVRLPLPVPVKIIDGELDRELRALKQCRFFQGFNGTLVAEELAERVQAGDLSSASDSLKATALSWCARILSSAKREDARRILDHIPSANRGDEWAIAQAFVTGAQDQWQTALNQLSTIETPEARTAAFFIVCLYAKTVDPIAWLNAAGYEFNGLDSDGKYLFLSKCLDDNLTDDGLSVVELLGMADYATTPAIHFLAALLHLLHIVPKDFRILVRGQLPFELDSFPMLSTDEALKHLETAQTLFTEFSVIANKFGMLKAAEISFGYALWLELRNPRTYASGIEKLRDSMANPQNSLRLVNFALRFGLQLDLTAISEEIDRQTALTGGLSFDAAFARFTLAFSQKSERDVAAYIDRHRDQLLQHINSISVARIEIEMLARDGQSLAAKSKLKSLEEEGIDETTKLELERVIAESEGADAVESRLQEYATNPSLNSLNNLVSILERRGDWEKMAEYSAIMFEQVPSVTSAEKLARALNEKKDSASLNKMLQRHPEFIEHSPYLKSLWAVSLYNDGKLQEAARLVQETRSEHDNSNLRQLWISIGITSGDWESLNSFLEVEWLQIDHRSPEEIVGFAQLSQALQSGRTKDFLRQAVVKSERDPRILMSAYSLASSAGWETDAEASGWLRDAIANSSDTGPIQKISLKEMIDRQPDWEKREADVWSQLKNGELPIFGAAKSINRTLCDLYLLPSLANLQEPDPRRRANIYAYSAARPRLRPEMKKIAFDATSLLTLTICDVVSLVFNAFDEIWIPHTTLWWLFDESQRINFHQPSRVAEATKLRSLLQTDNLVRFEATATVNSDLAIDAGYTLASLLAEAEKDSLESGKQCFVVHSYPVHRVGTLMDETVDMDSASRYFCSCGAVIDKLWNKGVLTKSEARDARNYLAAHERRWPDEQLIADDSRLYLDDLACTYLQTVGVLDKLKRAGLTVMVSPSETKEVNALLNYQNLALEAQSAIDGLRKALAQGIKSGKVKIGPLPDTDLNDSGMWRSHPTVSVLDVARFADAIVVDDRYLNQHTKIGEKETKPLITTLDLFDALVAKGEMKSEFLLDLRTKLRKANFMFIPVDVDELNSHLATTRSIDGNIVETGDLKAIRESILATRMSAALQLPHEAKWLIEIQRCFSEVLQAQWNLKERADPKPFSNWLLPLIDVRGWRQNSQTSKPPSEEGLVTLALSLLKPASRLDDESYWAWLDEMVLLPIQEEAPQLFERILTAVEHSLEYLATRNEARDEELPSTTKSALVAWMLRDFYPPSIRSALLESEAFVAKYGFEIDSSLRFTGTDISINKSILYSTLRDIFSGKAPVPLRDSHAEEWTPQIVEEHTGKVVLVNGSKRLVLPEFWMFLPSGAARLDNFERTVKANNFDPSKINDWREKLSGPELADNDVDELFNQIKLTPSHVSARIRSEIKDDGSSPLESLVPPDSRYFHNLAGVCDFDHDFAGFVASSAQKHIGQLIGWDHRKGLKQVLLLSSHSSLVALIDIRNFTVNELLSVYEDLMHGDRYSQLGAIELGLSQLQHFPELELPVTRLVQEILADDITADTSRFALLSSLSVLVDGQVSRLKILEAEPPFWRRLASIAQASMIERCLGRSMIDIPTFVKWAHGCSGKQFYFQTLCDLRMEPKWFPDFISPHQLKQEFLGRIFSAAENNSKNLISEEFRELLLGTGSESVRSQIQFPYAFFPGPLEGGSVKKIEPPSDIAEMIDTELAADDINGQTFTSLINSVLVFEINKRFADQAALALRRAKHYVKKSGDGENLFALVSGLATVSAVARSPELAEELRILIRRLRAAGAISWPAENTFRLGMIAAAANSDLSHWCNSVADWITELAFTDLPNQELRTLHRDIKVLCDIVPELWGTLGRAEAAVASVQAG